jgi:hypothetical protein
MFRANAMTYERLIFRKVGLGVAGLALIALGARWWYGVEDPGVDPPAPVVVAGNRFEDLRRAAEAIHRDKIQISAVLDAKPGARAAPEVSAAELLARNAVELARVRDVLRSGEFRLPAMRSLTDTVPYLSHFRDVARLLVLEGREYEKRGEWGRAAASYTDVLRLAERTSRGSALIGHLTALAIGELGASALYELTPKLDAATARATARAVTATGERWQTVGETLVEEKYSMQGGLLELFRHPERLRKAANDEPNSGYDSLNFLPTVYLIAPKREAYANITAYMDATIARARAPYRPGPLGLPEPGDLISRIFLPMFTPAVFRDAQCRANRVLVATRLALYARRAETGAWPESLADVPGLAGGAADPFRAGQTLVYRRDDKQPEGFLLYSAGPDAKDDGGAAIDNPKPTTGERWTEAERRKPTPESKGDLVMGINYPKPGK